MIEDLDLVQKFGCRKRLLKFPLITELETESLGQHEMLDMQGLYNDYLCGVIGIYSSEVEAEESLEPPKVKGVIVGKFS